MSEFPTLAVASVYSGFLLCHNFSEVHEVIERLAGGSVWTHQLPRVSRELRPHIDRVAPSIAAFDYSGTSPATAETVRLMLIDQCGATVDIPAPLLPSYEPDPFRDMPAGKHVAVIGGLGAKEEG